MEFFVQASQIAVVVITAIWGVLQMKSGQERFNETIERLNDTIESLSHDFAQHKEKTTEEIHKLDKRIIIIDGRIPHNGYQERK